jgi:hypothetical protein
LPGLAERVTMLVPLLFEQRQSLDKELVKGRKLEQQRPALGWGVGENL